MSAIFVTCEMSAAKSSSAQALTTFRSVVWQLGQPGARLWKSADRPLLSVNGEAKIEKP